MKCTKCKLEKQDSDFNNSKKSKTGKCPRCKDCCNSYYRNTYASNPAYGEKRKIRREKYSKEVGRQYLRDYYCTIRGRAKSLVKTAKRRSSKFNELSDIDEDFIIQKLLNGKCEVTGIEFDFNKHSKYSKNPYAPSIDRIDSSVGYIKTNVRMVIWQVNLMKGELSDFEFIELCRKVINGTEKV